MRKRWRRYRGWATLGAAWDGDDEVATTFRRRLGETRLIEPNRVPEGHAARMGAHFMGDLLARLAGDITFVDTYSVEKRCELVRFMGRSFIVVDHALSEHFGTLNYVFGAGVTDDGFTAGLLQRALAEACRMAGFSRRREYAFFVRRALEMKPLLRLVHGGGPHSPDIYWQDMLVMGHELAHAIAPTDPVWTSLRRSAASNASAAVDEAVAALDLALMAVSGSTPSPKPEVSPLGGDDPGVDVGLLAASLIQGGHDRISVGEVIRRHGATQRFLDEAACDAFGLALVRSALASTGARMSLEVWIEHVEDVLLVAYRNFLNMRFTTYATDAACHGPADGGGPMNPVTLDGLLEFSLRGRLARRSILEAWSRLTGREHDDAETRAFMRGLDALGGRHTDRLFRPFNALLEMTLFSGSFVASLNGLLEEDGFTAFDFDEDPFRTLRAVDGFWRVVAR